MTRESEVSEPELHLPGQFVNSGNISAAVWTEIEVKYHKNMQSLMEAEEKKRRAELMELEDRMRSRIVTLVEDHDRALRGAEEYYAAAQRKLLGDQKALKVRRSVSKSHSDNHSREGATGAFVSDTHAVFVCCRVGRARRGDEATGASRQRSVGGAAGKQTSDGVSAGSRTEAA